MGCEHHWESEFHGVCPYGWALPGEVTWPNPARAKMLNATLSGNIEQNGTLVVVWVFYGYIPYLMVIWTVLSLLARRGTQELSTVLFMLSMFVISDMGLKQALHQSRPEQSCLPSCGMPSSHAVLSLGFYVLTVLDRIGRLRSRTQAPVLDIRLRPLVTGIDTRGTESTRPTLEDYWSLPTPWDTIHGSELAVTILALSLVFLPVPVSRVKLGDHTVEQVLIGGLVGTLLAFFWFALMRELQHRHNHKLGRTVIGRPGLTILRHNAALPHPIAEWRCSGGSAGSRGPFGLPIRFVRFASHFLRGCALSETFGFGPISVDPGRELEWYMDQINTQYEARRSASTRRRLEALLWQMSQLHGRAAGLRSGLATRGLLQTPSCPLLSAPGRGISRSESNVSDTATSPWQIEVCSAPSISWPLPAGVCLAPGVTRPLAAGTVPLREVEDSEFFCAGADPLQLPACKGDETELTSSSAAPSHRNSAQSVDQLTEVLGLGTSDQTLIEQKDMEVRSQHD